MKLSWIGLLAISISACNVNASTYCEVEAGSVSGWIKKGEPLKTAITRVIDPKNRIIKVIPGPNRFSGETEWQLYVDGVMVTTCYDETACEEFDDKTFTVYGGSKFAYQRYEATERWDFTEGLSISLVQMVGTCYTDASKKTLKRP